MSALLSPEDLRARQDALVLDAQYTLDGRGPALYAEAHLPGAAFVDLDTTLAGPPGEQGRHPLPDPVVLQQALRRAGVDDDSSVVVYDQGTGLGSARAWWVLRWAGLRDVHVLDGGLAAWRSAGLPVTTGAVAGSERDTGTGVSGDPSASGSVTVTPGRLAVLDADGAAEAAERGVLLDLRSGERYRGEVEPIDPVAGHIPGAVNVPVEHLQTPDGRLRPAPELRAVLGEAGALQASSVATTCGSGITAALGVLALHEAGVPATPYIGSWSEWVTDPDRPVARGE